MATIESLRIRWSRPSDLKFRRDAIEGVSLFHNLDGVFWYRTEGVYVL